MEKLFPPRLRCFEDLGSGFADKVGLEIGGPSSLFGRRGLFPVYPLAGRVDNCNFSSETVWEGRISAGRSFRFDRRRPPGRQFIGEATDLGFLPAEAYDFVLSSHTLEHSANPLRALLEWKRILAPDGALLLILPHKDGTFDHRRPVTSTQHLLEDFERQVEEDDLTHLGEILELHDLSLDPPAGGFDQFRSRSEQNFSNRCLHHHVFDTRLAVQLVELARLQIRAVETAPPFHIAVVAEKRAGDRVDNVRFLREDADYRRSSPFPSDGPKPHTLRESAPGRPRSWSGAVCYHPGLA